ncbi:MAG TPA: arginine--tRNA ligase [Cytophagales bacterium]|nr:arginine--tRNA ligase [Cytophagales bacterium]HAA19915.1 arginine--tRNA ligase [Cytophagales bacterium]HAP62658.1 arginine--tRNA ligase [Cytophagales bacterium]
MNLEQALSTAVAEAFEALYGENIADQVALQPTKKEFAGTYTFVTFPYSRITKEKPDVAAQRMGEKVQESSDLLSGFNVVKGFLNLEIGDAAWVKVLASIAQTEQYGVAEPIGQKVMVEYSSPNTNKPLHLGHLRNNFLGYSVSQIMDAAGYEVKKVNLVNDRGIHICKSMLAYQKYGEGETPESAGIKGDHLIGKYYVEFDKHYKAQQYEWMETQKANHPELASIEDLREFKKGVDDKNKTKQPLSDEERAAMKPFKELQAQAEKEATLLKEAQEMLRKWEQGDEDTVVLWKQMNGWVYDGFNATYNTMGVTFDKFYYESDTYLLGKDLVEDGLSREVFYQKDDGSVWADLSGDNLDQKLVLRSDGTSVYMTQDMGTSDLKFQDFAFNKSIYVVGNEQDYHFQVLFTIMKKLGREYADGMYHLSYGMVDLPTGKMKSREGTVVDADDLMAEMQQTAKNYTAEKGKIDDPDSEEAQALYHMLGMAALKYYLLRVDPKKRMLFNPQESIEFQGDTGPFIQYTHARIKSVLRRAEQVGHAKDVATFGTLTQLHPTEVEVMALLARYPDKIQEAADTYSPSVVAQFAYDLAKEYNRFYQEVPILNEVDAPTLAFRLAFSEQVAKTIAHAMQLLGIQVPERM